MEKAIWKRTCQLIVRSWPIATLGKASYRTKVLQVAQLFVSLREYTACRPPLRVMTISDALDPALQMAIDAPRVPGITIGCRAISIGDEYALMPEEASAFVASVARVKRASGAARTVARQLLAQAGFPNHPLRKAKSGAPIWPQGVVGSMSHDSTMAVAAVAMRRDFCALGIDIEPAESLPPEVLEMVTTPRERAKLDEDPCQGRLLFAAKEAVYKAVYPLDQLFLDHHDVEVSLTDQRAVVCNGRVVELRFGVSEYLLALAFLRGAGDVMAAL